MPKIVNFIRIYLLRKHFDNKLNNHFSVNEIKSILFHKSFFKTISIVFESVISFYQRKHDDALFFTSIRFYKSQSI